MSSKLPLLAIVAVSVGLTGCFPPKPTPQPTPTPEVVDLAQEFKKGDDLRPEVAPPQEANLILNGTEIPVTLKEKRDGGAIVYTWMVDDKQESGPPVEVESEKYFFSGDLFSFSATAHEKYNPAINLIRYPLEVGTTSWDWTGEVITGKTRNKATATITTEADSLNLPGGKVSALLVKVQLTYSDIAVPATRELKFWFQPGAGLIRRELWASSTRTPRGPILSPDTGE